MTETEAKNKWCPMVRFHIGADKFAYDNKPGDKEAANPQSAFCIASACMMWRWVYPELDNPTAGYCGLAGK